MKKMLCLLLAAVLLLAGCGSKEEKTETAGFTGSMEELIAKIYENHGELEIKLMTVAVDLTDADYVSYNMGIEDASLLSDAAVSEPMIGSIPYSLLAVRVKNAADAEAVAGQMLEKIDTRKWICVEADTKTAAVAGDVVMFFMVGSNYAEQVSTESMAKAFDTAVGGAKTIQ